MSRRLPGIRSMVFSILIVLSSVQTARAWNAYEHAEIGDIAFRSAISIIGGANGFAWRKLQSQPHISNDFEGIAAVAVDTGNYGEIAKFSFGQLMAIYGDYALQFEDVNNTAFAERVEGLKLIAAGTDSVLVSSEHNHMRDLAVNNGSHFSLLAAQEYVRWHDRALSLARVDSSRLWVALHYEALALHSLSDLFALGHMLENRELTDQIFRWATPQIQTGISTGGLLLVAEVAGKLMGGFVNFYHNAYNWRGAMMMNLLGDSWRGFGDTRYRIVEPSCNTSSVLARRNCNDPETNRQRQIVVRAAAVSIASIFEAALGSQVESRQGYDAMCYLPVHFWNSQAPIDPQFQLSGISKLYDAMAAEGRSLENHGFDFSKGFLRYTNNELRGTVSYVSYIKEHCNLN